MKWPKDNQGKEKKKNQDLELDTNWKNRSQKIIEDISQK